MLFYGYATGVFSSRKIEQATYYSVAFRFISANTHPDHDTIATFRKRFLGQLKPLFVQILLLAREMEHLKLVKIGFMLADAGYYSDDNVTSCKQSEIEPFIPPNREKHNSPLTARFTDPVFSLMTRNPSTR